MTSLQQQLFDLADPAYKAFHQKLIPTIPAETIMGIRTPHLRRFAKTFSGTPEAAAFLEQLPHTYYEENNLHAFLIEKIPDFDTAMAETERFLPYIDNWATCDMFAPKLFQKHPHAVYGKIKEWLQADHCYTVRFGIVRLMSHYLDEQFQPEMPKIIAAIQTEEYYINMASAWYFATGLAKQYDAILPFFQENRLSSTWIHNKAIQKAIESRRITSEQKALLRSLKRK